MPGLPAKFFASGMLRRPAAAGSPPFFTAAGSLSIFELPFSHRLWDLEAAAIKEHAKTRDLIAIGGGQAGLAVGYYLRRAGLDFTVLDDREAPGAAESPFRPPPGVEQRLHVRQKLVDKLVENGPEKLLFPVGEVVVERALPKSGARGRLIERGANVPHSAKTSRAAATISRRRQRRQFSSILRVGIGVPC